MFSIVNVHLMDEVIESYILIRKVTRPFDQWVGFKRHAAVFTGLQMFESSQSLCLVTTEVAVVELGQ